ncbi:hypothetical protein MKW94_016739 [Papaver nudicaule]|uniref:Peroxidase n=1 Tax=Papaver nudicaule TaxID=74823 RepID=A0AA41VCC9_PAPNU|nr:hypothetical protein [Papaver nudicaule]
MRNILSFFVLAVLAVILSIVASPTTSPWKFNSLGSSSPSASDNNPFFREDFYSDSCPGVETAIRSIVIELFMNDSTIAPALIRLVFHDCFIQGCDGSVLLNSTDGGAAEKDVIPNQSLKGFDVVEEIKSRLEAICPNTVSCSDILVLAARDCVYLSGGPFYRLRTGRKDSLTSFPNDALDQIPAPSDDLDTILQKFSGRGFSTSETVSLLGAHSIGRVHCDFITDRLHDFNGTNQADPRIETGFLTMMQAKCAADPANFIDLKKEGAQDIGFGTHYFQSLVQNYTVLLSDHELLNSEKTASWVRAYASNQLLFTNDFSNAMIKLSELGVLTGPQSAGEIRRTCSATLDNV